jgi:flagellar M-ring protein FliF
MNEKLVIYRDKLLNFWKTRNKKQKLLIVGSIFSLIVIIAVSIILATRTNFVPLYSNLSPQEAGQIKAALDERGIPSQITDNGTTIKVPEQVEDSLKVELAAEGIPDSGKIDYSFFGKNIGFGMTENEFNMLKLEAMQTELANLIKGIEGVNDAKVMINLPEKSVFVNDNESKASASIVLDMKPGYQFEQDQIRALYHLVSKSVPNLPTENIVIMNENFEYFDLDDDKNVAGKTITNQLEIKKEIERDIQQQVQRMLGTMMGQDKVVVSVTADIDFTQENREENLVTPVDPENMEGIAVSVERITETFTGNGERAGGIAGTGETDVANQYVGADGENGDYERIEERINNEVNRIRKEIVESPYKIRDLGIQVMVEPPDPNDPNSLPPDRVNDIEQILNTIVRTSIDKEAAGAELTDEQIEDKVVVSVQPFDGKIKFDEDKRLLPLWVYIAGGVLLLTIIILLFLLFKKKRTEDDEEFEGELTESTPIVVPDVNEEQENESTIRRKQLEKLAKEKPEEFAKLLRTWLAED